MPKFHRIEAAGPDEPARSSRSFNSPARDLEAARGADARHRARLEAEAIWRTAELTEVDRRLAEQDQRCRRCLADVSHELRTPLAVVRGEAEVALRRAVEGCGAQPRRTGEVLVRFVGGCDALPGGSGLGLPVAKAIAEAHGGTLSLASREGARTVATATLSQGMRGLT